MSLIINGRYYTATNAQITDMNYLALCGLRFPLKAGRQISDEEKSYMKQNSRCLQEFKIKTEKEINNEGRHLEEIKTDIETKKDIVFFLSNLCEPHNPFFLTEDNAENKQQNKSNSIKENELIFPRIINTDYAIINKRLYPLKETSTPLFVNLNNKNYTIDTSNKTVEDVESYFQKSLEEKLKIQALKNSLKIKDFDKNINSLSDKIISLEVALKVSRFKHCYEFGDIGYDFSIKCVYWLIHPHYNKTTKKSYKQGQSAATISLNKGQLGTTGQFAERKDRNHPFRISNEKHCMGGCKLVGNSNEDKMYYLHSFANTVKNKGGFHE